MAQGAAVDRVWGDEADHKRLQQYRLRLEQVLTLLREREAAHRAGGAAPQVLKDAIRGFALELRRVRSHLRALERAQGTTGNRRGMEARDSTGRRLEGTPAGATRS